MPEVLDFVPAEEGLRTLDKFVVGKSKYTEVLPFTLPVRHQINSIGDQYKFVYYLGSQSGVKRQFCFFLSENKIACLGENFFVVPHGETERGQNPYYWLNLHASPATTSSPLTSCRLDPEAGKHKIDFQAWHGLEEQLLADYILGRNNLRFVDSLPFDVAGIRNGLSSYQIAGEESLTIKMDKNPTIQAMQENNVLRFIPKTDDQGLYEWVDILKVSDVLPEERWPLVFSYRILAVEHRIISKGWFGPERQLLLDRIKGESGIRFANLRPIRTKATSDGRGVYFLPLRTTKVRVYYNLGRGILAPNEETISLPKQDNQGLYEWLELYRFDSLTNGPAGEVVATGRITPEGINQQQWLGFEKQILKDYTDRLVSFDYLKPVPLKFTHKNNMLYLWTEGEGKRVIYLMLRKSFGLRFGDSLTLVPERETEEGTDFLLVKGDTTLARLRLNLETKKFSYEDLLVIISESSQLDSAEELDLRNVSSLFSALPQDQAWEVVDQYWQYVKANPECRMDIPEYYARVLQGKGDSVGIDDLQRLSIEKPKESDLALTRSGLKTSFLGNHSTRLAYQVKAQLEIEHPEYFAKRKNASHIVDVVTAEGRIAFFDAMKTLRARQRDTEIEELKETDLPLSGFSTFGLLNIFRGAGNDILPIARQVKAQLEIEHPEYFAKRKNAKSRKTPIIDVVTAEGRHAFIEAISARGIELRDSDIQRLQEGDILLNRTGFMPLFIGEHKKLNTVLERIRARLFKDHPEYFTKRQNGSEIIEVIIEKGRDEFIQAMLKEGVQLRDTNIQRLGKGELALSANGLGSIFQGTWVRLNLIASNARVMLETEHPEYFVERTNGSRCVDAVSVVGKQAFIEAMISGGARLK